MADAKNITRRTLMVAAPVAFAAPALAVPAPAASADTPVMALFRQWQVAAQAEDDAADRDLADAEIDALSEARAGIERAMIAEPSQSAQDFICKVIAWTSYGVFALKDREQFPALWAEADRLITA